MSLSEPPSLEKRRAADFERELSERAAAWVPEWSRDPAAPDFGSALLKIAARFSSEVAERLDKVGGKMALGFLDWLGMRSEPARPARLPVSFKLAETAPAPVTAQAPIKMQADAAGQTVTFETETDLRIVPGTIEAIVGVNPAKDAYYLPPPGLTTLDPPDPLPTQWQLKSFAAAGATVLQLDPGAGLPEGMLIEIAGAQYEVLKAQGDLITIEPHVPAGGFAKELLVRKVPSFRAFDGVRNRQQHILYIGDPDLLDIRARATIELRGLTQLGDDVTWEYWGKRDDDPPHSDAHWCAFDPLDPRPSEAVLLKKPKGAVEPMQVGAAQARWLRARQKESGLPLSTDGVDLRINPLLTGNEPDSLDPAKREQLLPPDIFVNSTSSPPGNFYLLGREPKQFDTLYLGSSEAFSKPGATAWVQFDLSDALFKALTAFDTVGLSEIAPNGIVAGVDKSGALHLLEVGTDGTLRRFRNQNPLQPGVADMGAAADAPAGNPDYIRLTSASIRPVIWQNDSALWIAVAASDQVWARIEASPFDGSSGWRFLGSLPPAQSTKPIEGLATIRDPGRGTLMIALRDHQLYWADTATPNPQWEEIHPTITNNEIVIGIAALRTEDAGTLPKSFLAVVENTDDKSHALYRIVADQSAEKLIDNIAPDLPPFGIERATGVEAAAVIADHETLAAFSSDGLATTKMPVQLASGTSIDGHFNGLELVLYVNAVTAASAQALAAWYPFDADFNAVVLEGLSDPGVEGGIHPIAVTRNYAYLAGGYAGEIFAGPLSGATRFNAAADDFRAALALPAANPTIAPDDRVAIKVGNGHEQAVIEAASPAAGLDAFANQSFCWLDRLIDRDTKVDDVLLYLHSSELLGSNQGPVGLNRSKLRLQSALTSGVGTQLLVSSGGAPDHDLVEIVATDTIDPRDVTVEPALHAPIGPVPYWVPETIPGAVFPSIKFGPGESWNSNLLRPGAIHFAGLDPHRQNAIAVADDPAQPGRPQYAALGERWSRAVTATACMIQPVVTGGWMTAHAKAAANPELAWEYWNGTGWWVLKLSQDRTNNFRNSGAIKFSVPADLSAVDWAGKTSHWIRARLIGGDYGRESVTVISEPVPGKPDQTKQTVERTTEGTQPPYALNVGIAYAVEEHAAPQFLLTQDSGSMRDQSDANRTPGADIEIFTPLGVTLGRLDGVGMPRASGDDASNDKCIDDCDCAEGVPSRSPGEPVAAVATSATAARARQRALYIGFRAKLIGEPVKVLFAVDRENEFDSIAPLRVDALIGNRFEPVAAVDDTRALGETGLLTMAFPVEPTQTELFGQTLAWLRITPSGAADQWVPSLAGVYQNTVWARAAETMTRELVGASSGEPNLTLTLARPPVLDGSLELRVREPLGDEERDALLALDPQAVKSAAESLPGDWVLWKQVPDVIDCAAGDRVYALDEASGTIRFGDGLNGMIPPIGRDAVVAFSYSRADVGTGAGVPANAVEARSALNLVTAVESVEGVRAADRAAGGVPIESAERVLAFAPARLRHRGRAVSAEDMESLVRERSAEVAQARTFLRNGRVRVVVAMRGRNPVPSRAQRRELSRMLLEAGPPALGAPGALTIDGPRPRRLRIDLQLAVSTLDLAGEVGSAAMPKLAAFFDTELGSESGAGWPLGLSPREEDVAQALLDVPGLQSIAGIDLFEIDADGKARPWPTTIRADDLAMLADDGVRLSFEVTEAAA